MRQPPLSPAVGYGPTSARPLSPAVGMRGIPHSPSIRNAGHFDTVSPPRLSPARPRPFVAVPSSAEDRAPSGGLVELRRAAQSLRVQHDATSLDGLRAALERERAIATMRPVFSPPPQCHQKAPAAVAATFTPPRASAAIDRTGGSSYELIELRQTAVLQRDAIAARDATITRLQGEVAVLRAAAADAQVASTEASGRDARLLRELAELRAAHDSLGTAHDAERARADAFGRAVAAYAKRERTALFVNEAEARAVVEREAADGTALLAAVTGIIRASEKARTRDAAALERVLLGCDGLTRELAAAHGIARDAAAARDAANATRLALGDAARTHASFVLSATATHQWERIKERDQELYATIDLLRASASALARAVDAP